MIEGFQKSLHLKMLLCQIDLNRTTLYESMKQEGILPFNFDIS